MSEYFGGRKISWCPSGEGNVAYCPRPGDPDSYTYCCTTYYLGGSSKPSCCFFPVSTGVLVAAVFGGIILLGILIFLTCWCFPSCPLSRRMAERRNRREMNEYERGQTNQRTYYS